MRMVPVLVALSIAQTGAAQNAAPLSAIDWMTQSVKIAPPPPAIELPKPTVEAPVSTGANAPQVTVSSLDAPSPDPVGLLPSDTTGLPRSLWANSDTADLIELLQSERTDTLPAIHDLMMTLLLAQADPPLGAGSNGALFLARIDKLVDLGALDPALAMLEQVSPDTPQLFQRWFDVALLTGAEDAACKTMRDTPNVAPSVTARIFCLARNGDWAAAALSLNTHRVLGDITTAEEQLLSRFLDPELYEGEPPLDPPAQITPLVFRMFEANGEPLPTRQLPNAYAHSDLRDVTGWKSQLDAAERLARIGAISENILFAAYTARKPAASGGVWDRARAVQRLDSALLSNDAQAISVALPPAWDAMKEAKLEVPFAKLIAPELTGLDLSDDAQSIAINLGLLTSTYETTAQDAPESFLTRLATGKPTNPETSTQIAIYNGFDGANTDATLEALARNGNLGEALLKSINTFNAGFAGDAMALTDALSLWRLVGLEDLARRAALQLLILDRAP